MILPDLHYICYCAHICAIFNVLYVIRCCTVLYSVVQCCTVLYSVVQHTEHFIKINIIIIITRVADDLLSGCLLTTAISN